MCRTRKKKHVPCLLRTAEQGSSDSPRLQRYVTYRRHQRAAVGTTLFTIVLEACLVCVALPTLF